MSPKKVSKNYKSWSFTFLIGRVIAASIDTIFIFIPMPGLPGERFLPGGIGLPGGAIPGRINGGFGGGGANLDTQILPG